MTDKSNLNRKTKWWVIGFLVLLAIGSVNTMFNRYKNAQQLEAAVVEKSKNFVKVALVGASDTEQKLTLPGTLLGFSQSPIAGRAAGYLKRWYKDIGSVVSQGEVIAEIDSPELDQQLFQGQATQQQAAESLQLAKTSLDRWEALRKKDVVSQQEYDERKSAYLQALSNLNAAAANYERLKQLTTFKKIVAPFSGVITKRNVDIGDLVDGTTKPLFLITQLDPLRVYVYVPQAFVKFVKVGQEATVKQDDLGGAGVKAQVTKVASAIDPLTRTMQIEVTINNKGGTLMPGAFVQVNLRLPPSKSLNIPSNALIVRKNGTQVAVVDDQNKVHLLPITVGRDYGNNIDVSDGLKGGEQVILNPSDSIAEGDEVSIVKEAASGSDKKEEHSVAATESKKANDETAKAKP
jgi:RND family efflux transporter MFP subunit